MYYCCIIIADKPLVSIEQISIRSLFHGCVFLFFGNFVFYLLRLLYKRTTKCSIFWITDLRGEHIPRESKRINPCSIFSVFRCPSYISLNLVNAGTPKVLGFPCLWCLAIFLMIKQWIYLSHLRYSILMFNFF